MSTIEINGAQIEYEEWGDGPETVVMLHSMGLCRGGMEPLADRLKDRYRILLWDYRGMGGSEKFDKEIGTETLYEDAVAVIRELGNGPAHLVGMSMGGWIGMRIAARQPQLVRSLTVMATTAHGADDHPQGGKFFETVKAKGFSDPEIVDISMMISFSPTVRDDPARAEDMAHWAGVMRDLDPRTIAVTHSLTTRLSVLHEIEHITAPTLVIAGEHDANHPPAEQEETHRAVSGSRFVVIENCGHTPIVERPDEVAATIRPFLQEADAVPLAAPAASSSGA
ncbi:MAG TPA: alpha/beta hydrolase [Baekduia sp.]|nr:alpha/beta hydrolase [Baekduia sp.]